MAPMQSVQQRHTLRMGLGDPLLTLLTLVTRATPLPLPAHPCSLFLNALKLLCARVCGEAGASDQEIITCMRVSASAAIPTTTSTPKGARVRRAATGARVVEPYRAMVA